MTAYATKDGYKDSIRRTSLYQQAQVATVKATPNGGSVVKNTAVNLTCETEGATIQFRGRRCNLAGLYRKVLTELPVTYKVKAVKDGYLDSRYSSHFTERNKRKICQIYFDSYIPTLPIRTVRESVRMHTSMQRTLTIWILLR